MLLKLHAEWSGSTLCVGGRVQPKHWNGTFPCTVASRLVQYPASKRSLGTRPSHAEEEEGLVDLHTYKFEVRGISAGWIWLVDDCVITFLPTKARVRVITTWRIWLTDQRLIQESKRPSFNKLRYSPANLEQLESCYERDRSLRFHYPSSGTVKVPLLR